MVAPQIALTWYSTPDASSVITAPDLWFDDGDVALVADNTHYRLHASLLACHSTRFRTMFLETKVEGTETQDTFQGCPLYTLPHRSYEVTLMLRRMLGFDRYVLCRIYRRRALLILH